jgi:hypothetical protein
MGDFTIGDSMVIDDWRMAIYRAQVMSQLSVISFQRSQSAQPTAMASA